MNGYSHPAYAASLAEFGCPRALPRSGGWLLERPITDTPYRDAMGCYPLFACSDWSKLDLDLEELRGELVSVAIVADPFGEHDPEHLRKCFPTLVTPFKSISFLTPVISSSKNAFTPGCDKPSPINSKI